MSRGLRRAQEQFLHVLTSRSVRLRPAGLRAQIRNRCHGERLRRGLIHRLSRQGLSGTQCRDRAREGSPHSRHHQTRELPSPLVPPLPVDKLAVERRRSPCIRKSGRLPWRSLQGSVTNRACSRRRAVAKCEPDGSERQPSGGNLASCLQAIGFLASW
jgi:hypothetical protein